MAKGIRGNGTITSLDPRVTGRRNHPNRSKRYLSEDEVLAGAKFYARAAAQRAVHGVIPNWDDEADEANWQRTRPDVREGCLGMVRGIVTACEFERRKDEAFERVKVKLAHRAAQSE
jgi:hypothetical protein